MFIPEYSLTNKIVKNIAVVEYSKALIDSTAILPTWQKQLEKEAKLKTIVAMMRMKKLTVNVDIIKKFVDKLDKNSQIELSNISDGLDLGNDLASSSELDEDILKTLHACLSKGIVPEKGLGSYRSKKLINAVEPEIILPSMVELFDWYNSLEAQETHALVVAAAVKARLEAIQPFETTNTWVTDITVRMLLKARGYNFNNYTSIESRYDNTKQQYEQKLLTVIPFNADLTEFIEYFTEEMAHEVGNVKEKVALLARDTKLAKASGRVKLSDRQQRIIEYLQDYGLLQNKDFVRVFPDVSEDSILRDLKTLINEGIVVKNGSTKSSRYELV